MALILLRDAIGPTSRHALTIGAIQEEIYNGGTINPPAVAKLARQAALSDDAVLLVGRPGAREQRNYTYIADTRLRVFQSFATQPMDAAGLVCP